MTACKQLAVSLGAALVLTLPVCAQTAIDARTATSEGAQAVYVADVDRENFSDLSSKPVTAAEVVAGLFPEDLETAEQRKRREACERIIEAGFKCMPPARSYTRFSLPSVNFALGSTVLPEGLKGQLKVFADVLRGRSAAVSVIRIDGHADASGTADVNRQLSYRRAESVRDFLVALGVDPKLFVVHGYGSDRLRDSSNPAAAENRRVEIARQLVPAASSR